MEKGKIEGDMEKKKDKWNRVIWIGDVSSGLEVVVVPVGQREPWSQQGSTWVPFLKALQVHH